MQMQLLPPSLPLHVSGLWPVLYECLLLGFVLSGRTQLSELGPDEIFRLSRLKIWNYVVFLQCMRYSFGGHLKILGEREESRE